MASVVNRTTKQYLGSVHTPDYSPVDWIIDPDLSSVIGVPSKYWNISGDIITEMTQPEKDAVDAAEAIVIRDNNRAEAVATPDAATSTGVEFRELFELFNKRDNYIINRLIEVQTMASDLKTAITTSSGAAQTIRDEVALVDVTPSATATRTRADTITEYKDDINAGGAD